MKGMITTEHKASHMPLVKWKRTMIPMWYWSVFFIIMALAGIGLLIWSD